MHAVATILILCGSRDIRVYSLQVRPVVSVYVRTVENSNPNHECFRNSNKSAARLVYVTVMPKSRNPPLQLSLQWLVRHRVLPERCEPFRETGQDLLRDPDEPGLRPRDRREA